MGIAYWLYQPEVWVIVGIILVVAELLDGSKIFFLPFGLGALLNALLISQQARTGLPELLILDQWWQMLISWAIFALLALVVLRLAFKFRKNQSEPDINEY